MAALGAWAAIFGFGRWGRFQVERTGGRTRPGLQNRDPSRLWGLWWGIGVLGLLGGGVLFQHPLVGLLAACVFPVGAASFLGLFGDQDRQSVEASAWVFFHGLHGLLRAGVSLPTALFRLASLLDSPFARRLASALDTFERGRSLSGCLARVEKRLGPSPAALVLGILGSAYDKGLPLAPFLERVLPWLEEETQAKLRAESALRQAWSQAALASVLPWGVAFLMAGPVGHWPSGAGWAAVGALALQALGGWGVTRMARFE